MVLADLVSIRISFALRILEDVLRDAWRHQAGGLVQEGLAPRPPR